MTPAARGFEERHRRGLVPTRRAPIHTPARHAPARHPAASVLLAAAPVLLAAAPVLFAAAPVLLLSLLAASRAAVAAGVPARLDADGPATATRPASAGPKAGAAAESPGHPARTHASPQGAPAGSAAPGAPQAVAARVFTIKFRDPNDVARLISPHLSDRGSYTTVPKLRTVTVQDRRDILDRIQEIINSYDVPPRNVEFTITLILATTSEQARQPISREVRGITEALSDITKWTDYKTLGSSTISGSEGSFVSLDIDDYHVEFQLESVSDAHGIIRLSPFSLQKAVKGENGGTIYRPVYKQTVNLKNDRLLTMGATKSEASSRALFLAIRAHIEGA